MTAIVAAAYVAAMTGPAERLGKPRRCRGGEQPPCRRLLVAEARRILDDVGAMRARVDAVARGHRGVLQVGFTSSAAAHAFTPDALRACRHRYPAIEWVVSESNAAEVTEGVASGRLHCGFVRAPVAWPEGVQMRTLLSERMLAAIPLDHPLAGQRTLSLADLHQQPVILVRRPGAPGLYARLLERRREAGAVPRVVAEVERMMTSLNLAAAGVGLTMVPASMIGVHGQALAYRELARGSGLDAPLTLLYRADRAGRTGKLRGAGRRAVGRVAAGTAKSAVEAGSHTRSGNETGAQRRVMHRASIAPACA